MRIRNEPSWRDKHTNRPSSSQGNSNALISINQDKCRLCYRCVRICPTHALKITQGKVQTFPEKCVYCGTCYKLCNHNAIDFKNDVASVLTMIDSGEQVVACLDSTFPAVLDKSSPEQLVAALKELGFSEVWETTFGGELVLRGYRRWMADHDIGPHISTFCPALVYYIEKYSPQLIRDLVPLISPMTATGKVIKTLRGNETKVVFIGSCIARIIEGRTEAAIDGVLTYDDILGVLGARGIERVSQKPIDFDGSHFPNAGLVSIAGGMSEGIGLNLSIFNQDYAIRSRSDRTIRAIRQLNGGLINAKFLDLLFCEGCIHGPIVDSAIPSPSRPEKVVTYLKSRLRASGSVATETDFQRFGDLDLKRTFTRQQVDLTKPPEEEIQRVLKALGKTYPDHNLDCGGCGYPTCRKKAIAVSQGTAELEMCPHFLVTRCHDFYVRLEKAHNQLKSSHEELRETQAQLIQTEKMASLGQMAAGVAHELNNPLGTITMFAGLLQRELTDNDKLSQDIALIVSEAERAAKIVQDLLSFSRKADVKPGLVDINQLVEETLALLVPQPLFHNIKVETKLCAQSPKTFADPDLLRQVFLNIFLNGAQAMEGAGQLILASELLDSANAASETGITAKNAPGSEISGQTIKITITDTGAGIPGPELDRIFDPFYTTKEKGTGLGLAIVYGIVSRHRGTIDVISEVGQGTTFTIYLPVLDSQKWKSSEVLDSSTAHTGGEGGSQRQDLIG